MLRYITIKKFAELSGYSAGAINQKINRKIWPKNGVWVSGPDGRRLIDMEGYELWASGQELRLLQLVASR